MNVLLTGFESFDKDPLNPSWEVARALGGWQPAAMNAACTVRAVQVSPACLAMPLPGWMRPWRNGSPRW